MTPHVYCLKSMLDHVGMPYLEREDWDNYSHYITVGEEEFRFGLIDGLLKGVRNVG